MRTTLWSTEGHANSTNRADVDEDVVVAEEMAAGTRAVMREAMVFPRTTHMEEAGGGRGNQASGRGRGRGRDNGQNYKGRCRDCHDSTEHGWHDCPLRLRHQAEDAQEQATVTHQPAAQAWFTRVQEASNQLDDFAIVIGKCEQVYQAPAAEQPAERAAAQERVPEAPAARHHHEGDAAVVDGVQALRRLERRSEEKPLPCTRRWRMHLLRWSMHLILRR